MSTPLDLLVIGTGRAASALGPRWRAAGHHVALRSRKDGPIAEAPAARVLVLAVPDGALAEVAATLAERPWARDEVWLHLSGVHAASVLRGADPRPVPRAVACLHPLVALAPGVDPSGAVAGLEGEPEAFAIAEVLARDAGLLPHAIPAERALYHAAAVSVAGHATALFAQAMSLLEASGFPRDTARRALQPLLLSAANNLARGAPEDVITGPITRGDEATVARHIAALEQLGDPHRLATYRLLAETALALSSPRLEAEAVTRLRRVIAGPTAG